MKEGGSAQGVGQIELESVRIVVRLGARLRTETTYVVRNHGRAATVVTARSR